MPRNIIRLWLLSLWIVACGDPHVHDRPSAAAPLRVRTQAIEPSLAAPVETYSGIVKAHRETRISSEVPARILQRHVVTGQGVRAGAALFTLETQALDASLEVARAELNAAQAERDVAAADLQRWQQLAARNATSAQSLDQARRAHRASVARVEAAQAQLALARVRQDRAVIRAPFDGVILRVDAEEGQMAALNATLALLADNGPREVEVALPDFLSPPKTAVIRVPGQPPQEATRVESGAALDAASKTWRARYRLPSTAPSLPLQAVVSVQVTVAATAPALARVPVGAIDERGQGTQVWTIVDGMAKPTAVQVVSLWGDSAVIATALTPPTRVISMGTHLLAEGTRVQELAP